MVSRIDPQSSRNNPRNSSRKSQNRRRDTGFYYRVVRVLPVEKRSGRTGILETLQDVVEKVSIGRVDLVLDSRCKDGNNDLSGMVLSPFDVFCLFGRSKNDVNNLNGLR